MTIISYSTHLSDSMEALMNGVIVLNTESIYSKTRCNINKKKILSLKNILPEGRQGAWQT